MARPEKTTTTATKTDVIAGKAVPKPEPSEMVVAEQKAGTLSSPPSRSGASTRTGCRTSTSRALALRAATNLRNFVLEGAGTDTIAAELARHGPDGVEQAEFPKVAVPGGSRTFEIPDWDALGKDSLADG